MLFSSEPQEMSFPRTQRVPGGEGEGGGFLKAAEYVKKDRIVRRLRKACGCARCCVRCAVAYSVGGSLSSIQYIPNCRMASLNCAKSTGLTM